MDMITMSAKEENRLEVMQRLEGKRMKQKAAADLLGISERQVKRLLRRYREQGASGLAQAAILDRLVPDWRTKVFAENMFLEELLSQAVK